MDIDSQPIGLKPTNKMSFEQLIEEKLKIQEQLDSEQAKFGSRQRGRRQQTLDEEEEAAIEEEDEEELDEQEPDDEDNNNGDEIEHEEEPNVGRQPRKFLKKGEGLKRYQPRPKKSKKSAAARTSLSSINTAQSTRASTKSTTTSRKSTGSIGNQPKTTTVSNNKTISTANKNTTNKSTTKTTHEINPVTKGTDSNVSNKNVKSRRDEPVVGDDRGLASNGAAKNNAVQSQKKPLSTISATNETNVKQGSSLAFQSTNVVSNAKDTSGFPATNANHNKPRGVHTYDDDYNEPAETPDDDELKEFESLEKYVEEHPSFQSSTSYVETFLSNNNTNNSDNSSTTGQTASSLMAYSQLTNSKSNLISQLMANLKTNSQFSSNVTDMLLSELGLLNQIAEEEEELQQQQHHHQKQQQQEESKEPETLPDEQDETINNSRTSSPLLDYSFQSRARVLRKVKRINMNKSHDDDNGHDLLTDRINSIKSSYVSSNYNDEDDDEGDVQSRFKPTEEEPDEFAYLNKDESVYETLLRQSSQQAIEKPAVRFDDTSAWLDQSIKETAPLPAQQTKQQQQQQQAQEPVVVSKLIGKLFPSIKEQEMREQKQRVDEQASKDREIFDRVRPVMQQQAATNANASASATLLREKLNQLESEIEKFQKKNLELTRLKEKLDAELKVAESNRKIFEKQKQDELTRMKELHEEEMRKLKLEKKVFEQYKQSIKEKPDRRERDEIERLTKQVAELGEELKTRETRWMANNNRLKERIETLEREKLELKKELQLIEKQRIESLMKITNEQSTTNAFRQLKTASCSSSSSNDMCRNSNSSSSSASSISVNKSSNQKLPPSAARITTAADDDSENEFNSFEPPGVQYTSQQLNMSYQPAQIDTNFMFLKRTTSEKSLPNSSSSSSSSSSIGSTGSLALHTNLTHQPSLAHSLNPTLKTTTITTTSNSLESSSSSSSTRSKPYSPVGQSTTKSVKFKLDQPPEIMLLSPTPASMAQPAPLGMVGQLDEYEISSLSGADRRLKVKHVRNYEDGHVDKLLEDGTTLTVFQNGTIKEISPDKKHLLVKFYNGDRKEVNHDTGTETYFYNETNITQTFYSTGLQILKFPNGQIEKHHVNKTREIIFPDKICKFIYADGSEETRLPNGTIVKVNPTSGDKIIEYPNKQREIHTKEFKRREYPDGSVKTLFTNGISETKYANGRVRLKDAQGNLLSDTKQ